MEKIAFIENELVNQAGPIASFVLNKQIKDLGGTRESFPESRMADLISATVAKAIYDPTKKKEIVRKLKKELAC